MQKKEVTIINNGGHDMEVNDGGEKITKVEKGHVGPWTVVQKLRRFCWNKSDIAKEGQLIVGSGGSEKVVTINLGMQL